MDPRQELLTEKEAAKFLGVSVSWLQKGRCYGYGPPFVKLKQPKGAIRYRRPDLDAYLQANTIYPEAMRRSSESRLCRSTTRTKL